MLGVGQKYNMECLKYLATFIILFFRPILLLLSSLANKTLPGQNIDNVSTFYLYFLYLLNIPNHTLIGFPCPRTWKTFFLFLLLLLGFPCPWPGRTFVLSLLLLLLLVFLQIIQSLNLYPNVAFLQLA